MNKSLSNSFIHLFIRFVQNSDSFSNLIMVLFINGLLNLPDSWHQSTTGAIESRWLRMLSNHSRGTLMMIITGKGGHRWKNSLTNLSASSHAAPCIRAEMASSQSWQHTSMSRQQYCRVLFEPDENKTTTTMKYVVYHSILFQTQGGFCVPSGL